MLNYGKSNGNASNRNFEFLMLQICSELKKRDKHKSGLILHNAFIEVMELFKIEYGTNVMDYLMRNCFVSTDGYVNYKNLLLIHDPGKSIRNNSEYVSESINPKFIAEQDSYSDKDNNNNNNNMKTGYDNDIHMLNINSQMKNEIIRKLYSQWDKSLLTSEEFIKKLKNANIEITPEFRRSIYIYGPSRSLKFVDVMKALYINDTVDRRNRTDYVCKKENSTEQSYSMYNDDYDPYKHVVDAYRNPIVWEEPSNIDINYLFQSVQEIANFYSEQSNTTDCNSDATYDSNGNFIPPKNISASNNLLVDSSSRVDRYGVPIRNAHNNNTMQPVEEAEHTEHAGHAEHVDVEHVAVEHKDAKKPISKDFFNLTIKNLIKLYIENTLSEEMLRTCLQKLHIPITYELNNLIKQHELNNAGKFKDFVTTIYRCLARAEKSKHDGMHLTLLDANVPTSSC